MDQFISGDKYRVERKVMGDKGLGVWDNRIGLLEDDKEVGRVFFMF